MGAPPPHPQPPTAKTPLLGPPAALRGAPVAVPVAVAVPAAAAAAGPSAADTPSPTHSIFRRRHRRRPGPPVYAFPAVLLLVLFVLVTLTAWTVGGGECSIAWVCRIVGYPEELYERVITRNLGPYAPFIPQGPADAGAPPPLPAGCYVDQVSVLHRHADRYPTLRAGYELRRMLEKIVDRNIPAPNNRPDLSFLRYADLRLDDWRFEELTDPGRHFAHASGAVIAKRYRAVADGSATPALFVRASGQQRVEETAQLWLQGFHGHPLNASAASMVDLVVPEGRDRNNTLSVHSCPAYEAEDAGRARARLDELYALLAPAAARLNAALDPQPPLTVDNVRHIADMCGFDSAARNVSLQGWSRWCRVLARDEWEVVGYIRDAERWYHVGEGSAFGKILGAGYVNELLGRLQDRVPEDTTCTNRTLNADPRTFPRGGRRVFADFTHDNEMIEILTALGVRRMRRKLPLRALPPDPAARRWVTARLIPFGARWAFERVFVRILLKYVPPRTQHADSSDAPANVNHMACRSSPLVEHHLCELGAFVESQAWSITDVDWRDCFEP